MATSHNSESDPGSNVFYRKLSHETPAIMHCIDADGTLVFVSDAWCQFLGYERHEVLGRRSFDFLTESSRQYAVEVVFPEFLQTGVVQNVPYQFVRKNGQEVDVVLSATANLDEQGQIIHAMAVIVDVSEQRQVEEQIGRKLLQLERLTKIATGLNRVFSELPERQIHTGLVELFAATFVADFAGLGIADSSGNYDCTVFNKHANGAVSRLTISQTDASEPFWRKLFQKRRAVVDGEQVSMPGVSDARFFALGSAMNQSDRLVGIVFLLHAKHNYSTDDFDLMERLLFLLAPMIRTRAELQQQRLQRREAERRIKIQQLALEHSSRLNAMGEMAGGLAHELNQPLTAIANFIDAGKQKLVPAQNEPDGSEPINDSITLLDKAEAQVFRAAKIVKRVRTFVSKSEPSREAFDVNQLMNETIELMQTDVRLESVNIDFTTKDESLVVHADRLQIQQVMVNLIQNAVDAVESMEQKLVRITSTIDTGLARISVADSGEGFRDENVSRLFTSMYTTKARGLGMGLSICRTIIESHGGNITAQNGSPGGAVFTFSIPASHQP